MNREPDSSDPSEQQLDRLLLDLPLRPAPVSLAARVFAEVQRREARAASRGSFARWAAIPRVAFVATCVCIVGVTAVEGSWTIAWRSARTLGAPALSWAHAVGQGLASLSAALDLIVQVLPAQWVYGSAALCIFLYVALFGLGTTAYRVLYLQSSSSDLP